MSRLAVSWTKSFEPENAPAAMTYDSGAPPLDGGVHVSVSVEPDTELVRFCGAPGTAGAGAGAGVSAGGFGVDDPLPPDEGGGGGGGGSGSGTGGGGGG